MREREEACSLLGKVSDSRLAAPLFPWGFTLRGRWTSQLHSECKDRRKGSQLGFRLFFTTLERQGGPCHFLSAFLD